MCGNVLNITSGEGECPVKPGEAYICLGGGTPLKRPINMVFRDLANFKAQDVSMYMYIPTLVIRGFFCPWKVSGTQGSVTLLGKFLR